jgi:hypothetical protein
MPRVRRDNGKISWVINLLKALASGFLGPGILEAEGQNLGDDADERHQQTESNTRLHYGPTNGLRWMALAWMISMFWAKVEISLWCIKFWRGG